MQPVLLWICLSAEPENQSLKSQGRCSIVMKSDGAVLVNKNHGITSFDVVAGLRRILETKRVGHCGTLDPLATGLLIVCFGRTTKLARFVADEDKQYTADILLGRTTTTFDRYGGVTGESAIDNITHGMIESALDSLTGTREQAVPRYSAAKHDGQPLYKYARKQIDVPVRHRKVTVYEIRMVDITLPHVVVEVVCSKGTYIRSLANELGSKLGCGAHLFALRRTRIGSRRLEDALTLSQISARKALGRLDEKVIPMSRLLNLPRLTVRESKASKIPNGVDMFARDIVEYSSGFRAGQTVSLVGSAGRLLAVGEALMPSSDIDRSRSVNVPILRYLRVV